MTTIIPPTPAKTTVPAAAPAKPTTAMTVKSTPQTIAQLIESKKGELARALPSHLKIDRLLRIVTTEIIRNPKLKECTSVSLVGAVMQAASLGLEPGFGLCYLIPYRNNKTGVIECQFQVGYKGLIELARRSGQITSISARNVYENDIFEYAFGLNEKLEHVPAKGSRGALVFSYAVAKFKDGGHQMEVMHVSETDAIRKMSKSSNIGPWADHTEEMRRKSVVRKLAKYLPISPEIQQAVSLDERADNGTQNNAGIFDSQDSGAIETEGRTVSAGAADLNSRLHNHTALTDSEGSAGKGPDHGRDLCDTINRISKQ